MNLFGGKKEDYKEKKSIILQPNQMRQKKIPHIIWPYLAQ